MLLTSEWNNLVCLEENSYSKKILQDTYKKESIKDEEDLWTNSVTQNYVYLLFKARGQLSTLMLVAQSLYTGFLYSFFILANSSLCVICI